MSSPSSSGDAPDPSKQAERKDSLNPKERELHKAIETGNVTTALALIADDEVGVDCLDQYGTTPLLQAAFKGQVEVCASLLAKGADVNSAHHEHGYTALMFGALSGNPEVCQILLDAGADSEATNRMGRDAAAMGSFTGQHACVNVINNYLPSDDLNVYTRPYGADQVIRLYPAEAAALQTLLRTSNVHPVRTILYLCDHLDLLKDQKNIIYILEDVIERQMKRKDANEVMSFKINVILQTVKGIFKWLTSKEADEPSKEQLVAFAKHLLDEKSSGYPEVLERMLRQAIKEFPYHHSVLMQQSVRTLSKTQMGDSPSAWLVIHRMLLSRQMIEDTVFCAACGQPEAKKRCAACKKVNYCSPDCQKLHWFTHKTSCTSSTGGASGKKQRSKAQKQRDIDDLQAQFKDLAPSGGSMGGCPFGFG